MPDLNLICLDEIRQNKSQEHGDALGGKQNKAAIEAVCNSSRPRGKKKQWQRVEHHHNTQRALGFGQFPNHPALGRGLDPCAKQGDGLSTKVDAQIAIFEGSEAFCVCF